METKCGALEKIKWQFLRQTERSMVRVMCGVKLMAKATDWYVRFTRYGG